MCSVSEIQNICELLPNSVFRYSSGSKVLNKNKFNRLGIVGSCHTKGIFQIKLKIRIGMLTEEGLSESKIEN